VLNFVPAALACPALATILALTCGRILAAEPSDSGSLITWLFQEGRSLKGIPFSEVLAAATGKQIIPVAPEADRPWLHRIGRALDRTIDTLNSPSGGIHLAGRINEASRPVENRLMLELNREPGWECSIPRNAAGGEQRSGYPDLRLLMENGEVVYLDPKLYDSRESTLRSFYYEPKTATNKVLDDARHLLVGIRHNGKSGIELRLLGWELIDVSRIRVQLKAEFQASNREMYREENVVAKSPARDE
jgi:hypothetical protein